MLRPRTYGDVVCGHSCCCEAGVVRWDGTCSGGCSRSKPLKAISKLSVVWLVIRGGAINRFLFLAPQFPKAEKEGKTQKKSPSHREKSKTSLGPLPLPFFRLLPPSPLVHIPSYNQRGGVPPTPTPPHLLPLFTSLLSTRGDPKFPFSRIEIEIFDSLTWC